MDANLHSIARLLLLLIMSTTVIANDDIVAVQLGKPSGSEELDIYTADIKLHHLFWQWGESGCQFGLGVCGGVLDAG
ncbi:hypothetical protein [Aeromonas taiwanensis]|uniref:hypothetical protein n=1 Tax=Aeromonas taiwanensis TaxID=633417 RepID=UPI003B9EF9FC